MKLIPAFRIIYIENDSIKITSPISITDQPAVINHLKMSVMINGIDLRMLRNGEFIQFVSNFSALVDSNDPAVLGVVAQQSAFMAKTADLKPFLGKKRASTHTPLLRQTDLRRNKAIDGIGYAIKSYCHHYDDQIVAAANLLADHLRLFGKAITLQNKLAKTGTINSIVLGWESKPDLTAALELLGLTTWVAELKDANQRYNQTYLERTEEYAAASPETMKGKRVETVAAYYELRKFLEANEVLRHDSVYEKTINELNELIEIYNLLITKRRKPTVKKPKITDK